MRKMFFAVLLCLCFTGLAYAAGLEDVDLSTPTQVQPPVTAKKASILNINITPKAIIASGDWLDTNGVKIGEFYCQFTDVEDAWIRAETITSPQVGDGVLFRFLKKINKKLRTHYSLPDGS